MIDTTQQCPSNWNLIESPVRGCRTGASTAGCRSTIYQTGITYNRACGRATGYQRGTTDAFHNTIVYGSTIEQTYVDGVSLTHGAPGSHQHIWTFAVAYYEEHTPYVTSFSCPRTNTNYNWTHQIPAFIGNNYFCNTGNPSGDGQFNVVFSDNPLWDGQGCSQTNTCCQFNNPPWFCASLPRSTNDDLELRLCIDEGQINEEVIISLAEIYVALE